MCKGFSIIHLHCPFFSDPALIISLRYFFIIPVSPKVTGYDHDHSKFPKGLPKSNRAVTT